MKKIYPTLIFLLISSVSFAQNINKLVKTKDVERIIKTLSADEMQGRRTFSPGIEKAAAFIENEFKKIGLQPLSTEKSFRQQFTMNRITPSETEVILEGNVIPLDKVIVYTDRSGLNWNSNPDVQVSTIKPSENFTTRYREIRAMNKQALVYVDNQFATAFNRLKELIKAGRTVDQLNEQSAVVFILGNSDAKSFRVNFTNRIEKLPLANVAGIIRGKSASNELVVFAAHYDHLGIIKSVNGDSIANGADDDASGVTAMIALAKYYKKAKISNRTLIFVAFTAEEMGGFGSQYFSKTLNPENVAAMFNIEMIGKESKFGPNSAFITGYERSNFGEILQKNLDGTDFKFYPDPYIAENLFYRSDNRTLAALGVPAHTISTDKIDVDPLYHTVGDEFKSLDVNNIVATIKAIALSSRTIIAGADTPSRIPKLETR